METVGRFLKRAAGVLPVLLWCAAANPALAGASRLDSGSGEPAPPTTPSSLSSRNTEIWMQRYGFLRRDLAFYPAALLSTRAFQDAAVQDAAASGELRTPLDYKHDHRLILTVAEIITTNAIMTLGGVLFFENSEGFKIGLDTWHENFKAGFEWDDNSFSANNFRHPYQGSIYFNAARSNHYDFYQSSLFAFAGAWSWEYFGEAHHPSFNDLVNTGVGGIAVGELLWRLSNMVLDNTATGSGRTWRELGGGLLNPARGVTRLLTGEAFEVHANPRDRFPNRLGMITRLGVRTLGDNHLWESAHTRMFLAIDGFYGDPFEMRQPAPFDHFTFGAQLNFRNSPHGVGRLESKALLAGHNFFQTEDVQHLVAGFMHFDYIDNEAYVFGGQSVGFTIASKFKRNRAETFIALHLNGILLGATQSDYFNLSGREYDYGPGVGFKFNAGFLYNGHSILTLGHESHYVHSVNGNNVDSYVNITRVRLDLPLRVFAGVNVEYLLNSSERYYDTLPDVSARSPELRLSFQWSLD